MIGEDEVRDALRDVIDPEVGMNIVDLGLVYGIEIAPDRVAVRMTMTSPGCPMGETILESAHEALQRAAPDAQVDLELVWDPPWAPERMSEIAREHLGWPGR